MAAHDDRDDDGQDGLPPDDPSPDDDGQTPGDRLSKFLHWVYERYPMSWGWRRFADWWFDDFGRCQPEPEFDPEAEPEPETELVWFAGKWVRAMKVSTRETPAYEPDSEVSKSALRMIMDRIREDLRRERVERAWNDPTPPQSM